MGKISEENISLLTDLFMSIMLTDAKEIISQLERMGLFRPDIDIKEFEEDINDLIDKYYGLDFDEIDIGDAAKDLFSILAKYHIKVPRDYMLLIRALALVEGVGKKLDPEFNAAKFFEPYAKVVAKRKMSPGSVTKTVVREMLDIQNTLRELPQNMKKVFDFIQQGKLSIDFEHKNLDIFARNMEHITNKLTMAIITAALIIGSALIMETNKGPMWLGFPAIGVAGFLLSLLLCLLISYSIWRYKI
jgi:ubiquinone biosynthesis protein